MLWETRSPSIKLVATSRSTSSLMHLALAVVKSVLSYDPQSTLVYPAGATSGEGGARVNEIPSFPTLADLSCPRACDNSSTGGGSIDSVKLSPNWENRCKNDTPIPVLSMARESAPRFVSRCCPTSSDKNAVVKLRFGARLASARPVEGGTILGWSGRE